MTLSVRSRFEVFKRDSFTCGYCGRTPDDEGVKLEVDHITPRAAGGGDELTNLVTSCWDCNHGKAAKSLGDKAPSLTQAMANTRERALQLDQYRQWQQRMDSLNSSIVTRVWDEWIEAFGGHKTPTPDKPGYTTWTCDSDVGLPDKRAILRQFEGLGTPRLIDAIHKAHGKWRSGQLIDADVQRYFFGTLKRMREEDVAQADECQGACGYTDGKEMGVWFENQRLRDLFLNHSGNGFESYADVVNALWPED